MTKTLSLGMQILLGLLMGILLVTGINLGISAFYPAPDYNTYCHVQPLQIQYNNSAECVAAGGLWNPTYYGAPTKADVVVPAGYCDIQYTCNQQYQAASSAYQSIIFYILVAIGTILAGIGLFLFSGIIWQIIFTGGGIALVIEGVYKNWNNKIPAFIAVVIAFVLLCIFIYKKVQKK